MSKLVWDKVGDHLFEAGVEQGVLYPMENNEYPLGVAWNGLTSFAANPSGAEPNAHWADNRKYLNIVGTEEFGATIGAFTYPDEFAECNGFKELAPGVRVGQQARKPFGFVCKTILGNDTKGIDYGYKLHLVYGCSASPSEVEYSTIGEDVEPGEMSWEISTTPVTVTGCRPTAHLEITSTQVDSKKLKALEDILFGTANAEARLPLPDEIAELMAEAANA